MGIPASREQLKEWCFDNKYTRWYISIVDKALLREDSNALSSYAEKHHIIPKSIIKNDGTNILSSETLTHSGSSPSSSNRFYIIRFR